MRALAAHAHAPTSPEQADVLILREMAADDGFGGAPPTPSPPSAAGASDCAAAARERATAASESLLAVDVDGDEVWHLDYTSTHTQFTAAERRRTLEGELM